MRGDPVAYQNYKFLVQAHFQLSVFVSLRAQRDGWGISMAQKLLTIVADSMLGDRRKEYVQEVAMRFHLTLSDFGHDLWVFLYLPLQA